MKAPGDDRITVLIIDDHTMFAESLVQLLRRDHLSLKVLGWASTATEGIARARLEKPDVVVMDFVLPDLDGATATRLLINELPDTKVIVLTGSDRAGSYFAAIEAGAAAWVRKSSAAFELADAVRQVYAGQRVGSEVETPELPAVDELIVHYQPVIDLQAERIVGFEALVRWAHPSRGLIGPDHFLPMAEETGFILEIGRYVGERAIAQLAQWQRCYPHEAPLWMSINLSVRGLSHPPLIDDLAAALSREGVAPEDLVLEVTETMLLEESAQNLARIKELKDLGVRLALDDFGSGFSSLSYLRRFPFDFIKMDNHFTAELPSEPRTVLLMEAVAQLADALGLEAIAEGVEREDQAACLREAGWRYAQGYLYSRPLAPAYFEATLTQEAG